MLVNTRQAWSKQGYVCRACRRQWQNAQQQRRWVSQQQTESSSSTATADSWFDTINDISDQYSSHKPTPPKPPKKPGDEEKQERREGRGRRARLEASKKPNARPNRSQAQDLKSLANSLATSVDSNTTTTSAEPREPVDEETKTATLFAQSRHRPRRKAPDGSLDVVRAELLSELRAGSELNRVRQDEGIDPPEEHEDEQEGEELVPEDTGPRPFPIFQGRPSQPVDTVDVPAGKVAAGMAGEDTTRSKVWKAKTSPAESGLSGHVGSHVLSNTPIGLLDRFKETQSRQPWGGAGQEATSSPPPKATFNTLTKADRVTPKKPVETTIAKKPFGIMDSLRQLWRGAPKDPMEGLRSRLLTTNEADSTSTTGFSFERATPDITTANSPVRATDSGVSETTAVDSQSSIEADTSVSPPSEQSMSPPQENDIAAVKSLTNLHANRPERGAEPAEPTLSAEDKSVAATEQARMNEGSDSQDSASSREEQLKAAIREYSMARKAEIADIEAAATKDLESALRWKHCLKVQFRNSRSGRAGAGRRELLGSQLQAARALVQTMRLANQSQNVTQAASERQEAASSREEQLRAAVREYNQVKRAEVAEIEAAATTDLESALRWQRSLEAKLAIHNHPPTSRWRKKADLKLQAARQLVRTMSGDPNAEEDSPVEGSMTSPADTEPAAEAPRTDVDMANESTAATQATEFPVEKADEDGVSRSASFDHGASQLSPVAGNVAHLAVTGNSSDVNLGMSLADAMRQDVTSKGATPKLRRVRTRPSEMGSPLPDKPLIAASQDVQQAADEAKQVLNGEPGPSAKKEEVEDSEVDDQGRYEQFSVQLSDLEVKPLDLPQPPVPYLEYGLDRVLFNPGVYQLQDAVSRVYNFDPYLQKIMPVEQFDFNSLKEYKTSSQDTVLAEIAKQQNMRYIGSTSSMTSSLAHFHYLISNWRKLNLDVLSRGYFGEKTSFDFTRINKAPSAVFLRWKNGSYAIDADKEYDSPNVLMLLGKSMELLLTLPKDEYEKYRKSDPRTVSEQQRTSPESYQYSTMGDFLMRSQLDAYDPRLPGNGTFDLKTRAVVSIRMSSRDHEKMTGYEIYGDHGRWCSYEKEYHDMARATMLKYMLQARMGRMNGIFVAYHNVKRIFGFQYIPISEMDMLLHGQRDPCLGDQEFKASLKIMNDLLNKATAQFPEQSLRVHFEAQESKKQEGEVIPPYLHMFAEPMTEEEIDGIQNKNKEKIAEYERSIMGKEDASATTDEENATVRKPDPVDAATENDPTDDATAYARQLLHSSDAPADKPFLERVETLQTSELRPLFYATVLVQSSVNGSVARDDGPFPRNLKPDDKWELNYLIKEHEITSHTWALYDDMKARRKEALWFEQDEEEIGEGLDGEGNIHPKVEKEESQFLQFLEGLSKRGGKVREKMDQADRESGKDKDIVRVDDPLPRVREKIESVEDYIEAMYRREQRD